MQCQHRTQKLDMMKFWGLMVKIVPICQSIPELKSTSYLQSFTWLWRNREIFMFESTYFGVYRYCDMTVPYAFFDRANFLLFAIFTGILIFIPIFVSTVNQPPETTLSRHLLTHYSMATVPLYSNITLMRLSTAWKCNHPMVITLLMFPLLLVVNVGRTNVITLYSSLIS